MPHPLVDDATRWWRAYQLAEDDRADDLRRLAGELRERAEAGDDHAREWLAWLAQRP